MEIQITLKAARVNANLTQTQAAAQLGVDRTTLQNYERGTTVPKWDVICRMQDLYKIPLEVLVVGGIRLKRIDDRAS